jgi:GxxExxY protein
MITVHSPLPPKTEKLIHNTIGCCIAVHRVLGPGLLEVIYARAISLELTAAGIAFEREKAYPVTYRGELLCQQHLDFVVERTLVLEIKSVDLLACTSRSVADLHAGLPAAGWPVDEFQCRGPARRSGEKDSLAKYFFFVSLRAFVPSWSR